MLLTKQQRDKNEIEIQKLFTGKDELNLEDFEKVCSELFKIPSILKSLLFERIKKVEKLDEKADKIKKQPFVNFWKKHCENCEVGKRVF